MASTALVSTAIRQFQSETDLVCEEHTPRIYPVAIWLLCAALVLVVAASFVVRIDRTVSSVSGKIASADRLIVVQALNPSIIRSIEVKAGQTVKKGQVLAMLDAALTSADLTQYRQQVLSLKAQIARAEAQLSQAPFEPDLNADKEQSSYLALQKKQFDKMKALYNSSVASFDQQIGLETATVKKFKDDEENYKQRLVIAKKQEAMEDYLVKSKTDSLMSLLTATDARVEIERQLAFSHGGVLENTHTLESSKGDRQSYIENFFATAAKEIVTARNNLDIAQAALDKAQKDSDLVQITAPESGRILTIDQVSIGSVLKQGDELMTIVPAGSKAVAEANIASRDIGFVRPGDKVRLKVDAVNSSEHGYADGTVTWISANTFTVDANGTPTDPYYKSRVSIDAEHFVDVPPEFKLTPGMTLTADINVGSRLLGRYLIGGSLRADGSEAMR